MIDFEVTMADLLRFEVVGTAVVMLAIVLGILGHPFAWAIAVIGAYMIYKGTK